MFIDFRDFHMISTDFHWFSHMPGLAQAGWAWASWAWGWLVGPGTPGSESSWSGGGSWKFLGPTKIQRKPRFSDSQLPSSEIANPL